MATQTQPDAGRRRDVHYEELSEVLADARSLAARPHTTVGQWTFAQIVEHLAQAMDACFDGFPFKAPWLARVLIAPFVKNSFLIKPMKAGFKLPKDAGPLLPPVETDLNEALGHLDRAIARFDKETPSQPHTFFGRMAAQEVMMLQLRHCELHMSFVVPTDAGTKA